MKPRPPLPEGPYLVVGLARSGAAAALMLREHGEVIGCDAGQPEQARALSGVEVHLESDGAELVERVRTVVKSPGVPHTAPAIERARERDLEVTGELELAWRLLPNEFVAVTGTNGKTTTTELLGAIHREAGVDAAVAGNVGTPLASLVGALDANAVVVCECSSFQLEDASAFAPECAALLNLAADHIDRHGSERRYREAKLSIFARQDAGDVAVAPPGVEPAGGASVVTFGGADTDLALREGTLQWCDEPLMPAADVALRGGHNLQNAMAAAAAALARGVPAGPVVEALASFRGVAHRLEVVGSAGGVVFVNDSKATNVDAAAAGIAAFRGGVHAILGGSLKGSGFEALRAVVAERCRACYLIGEAAGRLHADLDGAAPLHDCGDLERAVAAAAEAAGEGQVVLLSPACASYDQYADYEQRGDHFRALVRRLGAAEDRG